MAQAHTKWTLIIGRWTLASLFILGGINKMMAFSETALRMEGVGIAPAIILLPMTIALEVGGGVLPASGSRFASFAGFALAAFTLATNLFFHRFWSVDAALAPVELSLFFKNVAIIGGLLFVSATILRDQTNVSANLR